jgi:zinc transport system substrate-binding protein
MLACGSRTESVSESLVLVTIQPLAYFVEGVAGEAVRVETLLPPGANPHSFEPGIAELRSLEEASLLVTVGHPGLGFEQAILSRLPRSGRLVVVDGFQGVAPGPDPHLWLSPPETKVLVRNLTAALTAQMPERADLFSSRSDSLMAHIDRIDKQLRTILTIPNRTFYVFHDSWGIFARTYGLEQVAIEQEGHEPGPDWIATVIARARADSVRSIFIEPQMSRQSAELVASEVGARVGVLDPLAYDWSDNLIKAASAIAEASR